MAEITFFNMWEASSREDQEALIAEMRIEAPGLAIKDGFVSLAVWKGEKVKSKLLPLQPLRVRRHPKRCN
jgi:hypothetical protein